MKYSDIVNLRAMRPAYNIQEEGRDEWKTFIANDQFNGILSRMIKAVRNNDADNHKSVWIAGTYGTGKSHAGAVLEHLFCDPVGEISDYVNDEYAADKYDVLRTSLLNLRATKRLLPVNLYGQQSIAHEQDLSLQMQRAIKAALEAAGTSVTVKTDFDSLVEHIDEQPALWQMLIDGNTMLSSVAPDLKKLRLLLQSGDTEVLDRVRQAQRAAGIDIRMPLHDLKDWIFQVQDALRQQGTYSGLLIIWDEFTEIMTSSIGSRLLVILQEISEAMMNPDNDSYFLFISHPSALLTLKEDEREKTKGRYHYVAYNMEPVSAFKIMSKKFRVVNQEAYDERKRQFFGDHGELLSELSGTSANSAETIDNIMNLYPLHPATANLATYYAREAGSSSRSVFEFLADDIVRGFLDSEDNYRAGRTITADYLWDYVQPNFEKDTVRFGAVTERYNSHHISVEAAGESHLRVFKGILLLNALNNIANSDSVTPSEQNISNLFVGTEVEDELPGVLNFLNDKSIIQRQPDGNYSIMFTALPGLEIQKIKDDLASGNYLYTDRVLKFGATARDAFDRSFRQVTRPICYQFFSRQANEYTLLNQVENTLKTARGYEVFVAMLVGRNPEEVFALKDIAERNSSEERFANVAFLVMETPLGDKNYERFIEYQANAQCAQSHNLPDQQATYVKNASGMIGDWIGRMKGGNATFYLRGEALTVAGSRIVSSINNAIAPQIFTAGPESLSLILTRGGSVTYWAKKSVKATVDSVLSYHTKEDILKSSSCSGPGRHVEFLLQDSVDDNLEWKSDVDPNHPLKKVCDYIDVMLSGKHTSRNQSFNLGDKLKGLTEAPYGLYQSYAPMAMVAFAMRKYVGKIYDTNGKPRSSQHMVDDVVELFSSWEKGKTSNKLNFMFESREAGKLSKNLIRMFSLNKLKGYSEISSLKDARWAVNHEYAKEVGYPVWSLKYCDSQYNTQPMRELVDNVMKVVGDPESMKNPSLLSSTIDGYENQRFEWLNLLVENDGGNYRDGFNAFMKGVEIVNLNDDEIDDAMAYLRGHLEGEVGLWSESDVKGKLKDWRISQQLRQQPEPVPQPYPAPAVDPDITVKEPEAGTDRKRSQLRDALRFMPDREAKELLEDIVNKESGIILDTILKYVQ